VEYSRWVATYDQIRAEFGYSFDREERSAARLLELLPESARERPLERAGERLRGREVVVVGLAPGAGPPPLWRLPSSTVPRAVVAADGATADCLTAGIVPDVITTDLDGPVASEVTANRRGSLVVIHAHGDNRSELDEWVDQFPGERAGSWAGPPRPGLIDVGGFTDGDRGAYLAEHVGALRLLLWGFDFDRAEGADETERARKRAKLAWARRSLDRLATEGHAPLFLWERSGARVPYPAGR
jgi:uncharacterized Rossmann fold enzyme